MGNQLAFQFLVWTWLHAEVPWPELPELTSKNNTLPSSQKYFKAQNSSIAELQRRSYWSRLCTVSPLLVSCTSRVQSSFLRSPWASSKGTLWIKYMIIIIFCWIADKLCYLKCFNSLFKLRGLSFYNHTIKQLPSFLDDHDWWLYRTHYSW